MENIMKLKGLICEGKDDNVSIGRVLLWIVTIFCSLFWAKGVAEGKAIEVPISLLYSGASLLVYNLGTKMKGILKLFVELRWGVKKEV
jgi:hypothetical protein